MDSFFVLKLNIEAGLSSEETRDEFLGALWSDLTHFGLKGVHEGTVLSEQAHERGLETESFTIDAGLAPKERDWVSSSEELDVELYFDTVEEATRVKEMIESGSWPVKIYAAEIESRKTEDWNAQWKASFRGIDVDPFWMVLPPWRMDDSEELKKTWPKEKKILWLNPGAGFGTGTHETTQLCLETLGLYSRVHSLAGKSVLDFGSGSGILSIGAKLAGASEVVGVEIDELANENARENSFLNHLPKENPRFQVFLTEESQSYDLVLANILRPILLEFAETLVKRLKLKGLLVLSGLVATDLPEVIAKYSGLLAGKAPLIRERGDWRALVWDLSQ